VSVKTALDNEIELLKKHNNYLGEMWIQRNDEVEKSKVVSGVKRNQNYDAISSPRESIVTNSYFDQVNQHVEHSYKKQ
jgi:hypothetical protein